MKLFRTKTPAALDNPSRWNQYLKPWFDVERFQDRIDSRVGLNAKGQSILRLVWAQDIEQTLFDESTPRYWVRRRAKEYWTVPRWIIERRIEPEQYMPGWEQKRYAIEDPETGVKVDRGEPPSEYFVFAYLVAEHAEHTINGWPQCCDIAYHETRSRCWGRYRAPGDDTIALIEQAVRQMDADKFIDPYRPLSLSELRETELAANLQVERAQMEFEEYEQNLIRDFVKLHGHRLFEGPDTFHDLGANFQKADNGLYLVKGE